MNDLPPLNALRAFDAVAKNGGVAIAARALFVTHGAVSKQIRLLEDHLGVRLFDRKGRGLVLTDAGRRLADSTARVFDDLARTVREVRAVDRRTKLTISVVPSFAARWLVPRLHRFHQIHPDLDLYINATMELADLQGGKIDVAVRYGKGHWPDLYAEKLLAPQYVPVASPRLVTAPLDHPDQLSQFRLIHDDSHELWSRWTQMVDTLTVDARAGVVFDDFNVVLEAVLQGQGVALANKEFVQRDLDEGRLIQLLPQALCEAGFFFVCLTRRLSEPMIQDFRSWLVGEMAVEGDRVRF